MLPSICPQCMTLKPADKDESATWETSRRSGDTYAQNRRAYTAILDQFGARISFTPVNERARRFLSLIIFPNVINDENSNDNPQKVPQGQGVFERIFIRPAGQSLAERTRAAT
jgi:hypothetical protein